MFTARVLAHNLRDCTEAREIAASEQPDAEHISKWLKDVLDDNVALWDQGYSLSLEISRRE